MKSAAVVNFAPTKGSVEIREIEKPSIGDEDVLLEVANVGVCGSDLHQWTADHSWPVNYPVVNASALRLLVHWLHNPLAFWLMSLPGILIGRRLRASLI